MDRTAQIIPVFSRTFGSWELTLRRHPLNRAELVRDYAAASAGWHTSLDRMGVTGAYDAYWAGFFAAEKHAPLSVLDCGTGSGAFAVSLVRAAHRGTQLHGFDISEAMVATAAARCETARVAGTFGVGSVTDIACPANTHDLTTAAHVLEHLGSPLAGLVEMARVTRPGGRIVVCLTRNTLAGWAISLRWRTHCFSALKAQDLFEQAGLSDIQIRPLGRGLPGQMSFVVSARKPD